MRVADAAVATVDGADKWSASGITIIPIQCWLTANNYIATQTTNKVTPNTIYGETV